MKKVIFLAIGLSVHFFAKTQSKNFIDQPYIEVNGSADTLVTPDEIFISINLSEKDTKDRTSIEELEQKMTTILNGLSVDVENDLKTSDMLSNFKYYFLKNKDILKTKFYILKVSNAVIASKVFIRLEEIGISNISIDRVDYSGLNYLKNLMRIKAIGDAKDRAISLTKPLNQVVGSAIHIVDSESPNFQLQGRVAGLQIFNESTVRGKTDMPKIEFEGIKVGISISAKFILK